MKSIYTYYKERLIEISGKNRSVYARTFSKKTGYDIGRLFEGDKEALEELISAIWEGRDSYTVLSSEVATLKKTLGFIDEEKRLALELDKLSGEEKRLAALKNSRTLKKFFGDSLEREINSVRVLKREVEEIESETGRYELFIGYPFVVGAIKDVLVKAPLLFFPVEVEFGENSVSLRAKRGEAVRLNKALLFVYSEAKRLETEEMETEFDNLSSAGMSNVDDVLKYISEFGIKLKRARGNVRAFKKIAEPKVRDEVEVINACLLARYSLANSIYTDYTELEKRKLTSGGVVELLHPDKSAPKRRKNTDDEFYTVSDLDFAQASVVKQVASSGNMVIYGPPGTGKSQTIANLITDAVAKGKRVLVVSQKKAALDVVFNRLGTLSDKAMFIVDPVRQRAAFYDKCLMRHKAVLGTEAVDYHEKRAEIDAKIAAEEEKLERLTNTLSEKSAFGMSLLDMYYNSFIPGKRAGEEGVWREMPKNAKLMAYDYPTLKEAVESVCEKDKADIYYNYVEDKKYNPFLHELERDVDMDTLTACRAKLDELLSSRTPVFEENAYPYSKQIVAHGASLNTHSNEKLLIKTLAAYAYPNAYKFLCTSRIIFPLYPFAKHNMIKKERLVAADYDKTKKAIEGFTGDWTFLKDVLTDGGYSLAVEAILSGNPVALTNLKTALAQYVKVNAIYMNLDTFSEAEKRVLKFAYQITSSYEEYKSVLGKILPVRIYHEVTNYENKHKQALSLTVEFEDIKARINALLAEQKAVNQKICEMSFIDEYKTAYEDGADRKDYLYQISKKQNFWPIRRTMEVFGKYLLSLYPCWLLSPENVSTILPLKKDLFDVVLFDEASQVFIESTLPSIIRGKSVVVAGDAKQLRPTATFMRRYMGAVEDEDDLSVQAALEVESLLDLAVARYDASNIVYHYRSGSRELIDFSNKAFYENRLKIAPNVNRSLKNRPIERIKVDGLWKDRRNKREGEEAVALIKKILKNRKNKETIGIIAFGSEQQACIEDAIDNACKGDDVFRAAILRERTRKENGQDVGLFVKNIENVQGDERDIIIFSIGYARNESGKVNAFFGSLSADGGENRLNVAVTRAKKKVYVITSIEPEELKIEATKNAGPKLFKTYLSYARAVSNGDNDEVNAILNSLCPVEEVRPPEVVPVEAQIADKLTKLGYTVDTDLGEGIAIAVYDKKTDKYVLGIQTDKSMFDGRSPLERDVFSCRFLEQKGWNIMRVWSRDWWHNAHDVTRDIIKRLDGLIELRIKNEE